MTSSIKPEKIISAMATVVAAVTNMRLYPPASAIIANGIDKAYISIKSSIAQDQSLLIAETENNLLISGEALSYKHQQLPQVATLRSIMAGLRIKSIVLKNDIDKQEFKTFLSLLSMSPEEVELEGGIQKVTTNASLVNITLTPKIYVSVDQEREALGSLDPSDIELIKAFLGEQDVTDNEYMRIGEKAHDAQWVSELFNSSIKQLENNGASLGDGVLPRAIGNMMQAFETSAPAESRKKISQGIADSLFNADSELFSVVMTNNNESSLFDSVINSLNDQQYVEFMAKINCIREDGAYAEKKVGDEERARFNSVFKTLAKNKRTASLTGKIKEKILSEKERAKNEQGNIQEAIEKILSGGQEPFSDVEIMSKLPVAILKMFEKKQDKARSVINRMASGLVSEEPEIRAIVSGALLKIGERFSGMDEREEMLRLAHSLNLWIKTETEITPSYEPVCSLLQNHIRYLLKKNLYAEANSILETFSFIFYDRISKIEPIKAISGRVLRNVATEELFTAIMHEFNTNNNKEGKNAYYTLIRLGTLSLDSLLDLLRSSDDMSHRVRIMNAISEIGDISMPAVLERLQTSNSWFYIRNLLKLLAQMGSEENMDVLKQLLTSENPKISNAALNCAFEIGGDKRLKFFLSSLAIERDRLRTVSVDLLGKLGNEEAVYPLTELLKSEATGSAEGKNALDISICVALGKIGSKKAIPVLKSIVKQKGLLGMGAYSPEVRSAAENTIKLLNQKTVEKNDEKEKKEQAALAEEKDAALNAKVAALFNENPNKVEELVKGYISNNNVPDAVKALYQLIVHYAREKNFLKADEMRNWLFEVDPMALSEIVKSGDIIESEKSSSVVNEYVDIWSNLYDTFTEEEATALFYNTTIAEYGFNETIVEQCEMNSRLYFINRGQLKVVYKQEGNEFFLKMVGAGDIAGVETFFPITVSTVSLITLSDVKVGYLEREKLKQLKEQFPQLEKKLMTFCSAGDDVNTLINKKGIERRLQERIDVKGKAMAQLLDMSNKTVGQPFKGDLIDVSVGGLAFKIKTKKKDTARLLLGRKIKMIAGIVTVDSPVEISTTGVILGAKEKREGLYSIHLKFDSLVNNKKIMGIRSNAVPPE